MIAQGVSRRNPTQGHNSVTIVVSGAFMSRFCHPDLLLLEAQKTPDRGRDERSEAHQAPDRGPQPTGWAAPTPSAGRRDRGRVEQDCPVCHYSLVTPNVRFSPQRNHVVALVGYVTRATSPASPGRDQSAHPDIQGRKAVAMTPSFLGERRAVGGPDWHKLIPNSGNYWRTPRVTPHVPPTTEYASSTPCSCMASRLDPQHRGGRLQGNPTGKRGRYG